MAAKVKLSPFELVRVEEFTAVQLPADCQTLSQFPKEALLRADSVAQTRSSLILSKPQRLLHRTTPHSNVYSIVPFVFRRGKE